MSSIDDKKKALALVLEKMDKTYGKGTVMKMGDSAVEEVEVIPVVIQKVELSKFTGQNLLVKPLLQCTQLQNLKKREELQLL
jgi:hypothetical protein